MKKTKLNPKKIFGRWSMREKMMFSFLLPVLLVIFLCFVIMGYYTQVKNQGQLKENIEQSLLQADNYVSSYQKNMEYIASQITGNYQLNEIFANPVFEDPDASFMDQYLEFWQAKQVMAQLELYADGFRIGMYLPDEADYANDQLYFYRESDMQSLTSYNMIMQKVNRWQPAFEIIQESKATSSSTSISNYLARFSRFRILNDDREEKNYVIKVELEMIVLENILKNAVQTKNSLVYIQDDDDNYICSNDESLYVSLTQLPEKTRKFENWDKINCNGNTYYIIENDSNMLGWKLIMLIPAREFAHLSEWLLILIVVVLVSVIIAVSIISSRIARYYSGKVTYLNNKMTGIEQVGIDIGKDVNSISHESQDELDILYDNFDYMLNEITDLLKEQYRLGRSISRTELMALQAQINPHFLYNTLDLINWGAMDYGADEVADLARNLGQFYRLSLNHGKATISIEDELRHVQYFAKIENAHFDDKIHLTVNVPDKIRQYACLNISMQPFVENAIVHGIGEHPEIDECNIEISAKQEGDDLLIFVQDDGIGIDPETAHNIITEPPGGQNKGFGIGNVNFRIKLLYGDEYGVRYLFNRTKGTCACIKIKAWDVKKLEEAEKF